MIKKISFLVLLSFLLQSLVSVLNATVIPANHKQVLKGLSNYNWVFTKDYIMALGNGASIRLKFKGTKQVMLKVATDHMSFKSPERFPIIAWSVNGGTIKTHQIAANENLVLLSSGIDDPEIDIYVNGTSSFENRFVGDVPENSLKITGFVVDKKGTVESANKSKKVWLDIGDSIMAGDAAAYTEGQGRPKDDQWAASDDARASYGYLLAKHYGYCEARIAFGGNNWGGGLAKVPDLKALIDYKTSTISRLHKKRLDPVPDVILINLGENGAPAIKDITGALEQIRMRVKSSTKIIVMVPVSGRANAEVSHAFKVYQHTSKDENVFLIDLGKITFATADGQHPTAGGHQSIYEAALPHLDEILK